MSNAPGPLELKAVVCDVAHTEGQLARRRVTGFGLRDRNLGILHWHVVLAVTLRDDADRPSRIRFGNYFGGAVGLLVYAVANKDGRQCGCDDCRRKRGARTVQDFT